MDYESFLCVYCTVILVIILCCSLYSAINMGTITDKYSTVIDEMNETLANAKRNFWFTNRAAKPHSVLIDGPRGVGKSATVHYALQYAYNSDYLVIPVLAPTLAEDRWAFIRRSVKDPETFIQTRMTRIYLHGLISNPKTAATLQKVVLKRDDTKRFASQVW